MLTIQPFQHRYKRQVIELALTIQQKEFGLPIKLEDQPDLSDLDAFYLNDNGGFWLAIENERVVGSIGLLDIGSASGVIRKMFVEKLHRGKEKGIGQRLLNELESHCREKGIAQIYLGTVHIFLAAQRFYKKNGFTQIEKARLPARFPVMSVDDVFFQKELR